jgi:hypothetical protein
MDDVSLSVSAYCSLSREGISGSRIKIDLDLGGCVGGCHFFPVMGEGCQAWKCSIVTILICFEIRWISILILS